MSVSVVHLSDIHYGNDFLPWAILQRRGFRARPTKETRDGLRDAIQTLKPDFVVISGDFVNKAQAKWFSESAIYLRELLTTAGINVETQVLVVPGNHDVPFSRKEDDAERLSEYQIFLKEFFKDGEIHTRSSRFFVRDERKRIIFLALDTTLKTLTPRAEGEVGTNQLKWAKQKIDEVKDQLGSSYERYAKIAIMHHHCVPIPGDVGKKERNMQLLDTEGIMSLLKGSHFDVVLHGHKHVPHISKVLREDGGVMTVVGAGTTLAPYSDQQNGNGNNFNLVELDHSALEVKVSRYKSRENGSFAILVGPESYPLFKIVQGGFNTRKVRRITRILENGDIEITFERSGIRVTGSNRIKTLPVRITAETPGAAIRSFSLRPSQGTSLQWKIQESQMYEGFTVFSKERTSKDGEISLIYDYKIDKSAVMSVTEANTRYVNSAPTFEETSVSVTSEVDELEIMLTLPRGYEVSVQAVFERHGVDLDRDILNNKYTLEHDAAQNQWIFRMSNPPINHALKLRWDLPKIWTPS